MVTWFQLARADGIRGRVEGTTNWNDPGRYRRLERTLDTDELLTEDLISLMNVVGTRRDKAGRLARSFLLLDLRCSTFAQ